jgi:MscS family membrane protein
VNENARSAAIVLRRSGTTNSAVTVELTTADGTARPERDYSPKTGPVTIPAGKTEQTVSIPILDDFVEEETRTVRLTLHNPSAGAELGALAAAKLLIVDNDARVAAWLTFGLDRVEFLRGTFLDIPLWQYVASIIYIFLAFYVSRLLDHLIRGQLKKWAEKSKTRFDDLLLDLLRGPIKVVSFVILLHLGLRIFSWPQWFEEFLSAGLKVVVACSLTYLALKIVDLVSHYWKGRSTEEDKDFNEQLLPIIRNTVKVFVVVVAVLLTLQNLGLNITSLIASLSIGGLALSLAAQDTLANLFGAVAVLMDKPFRVGDRIQLDSIDGVVESIGLRSTRVRSADGHLVAIPNKTVGNATITNVARRPNIRTLMNIGLTYDTPTDRVKQAVALLEEVFRGHPMTQDVWISFNKFADSALNIQVIHWWNGTDYKRYLEGMHELNLRVKERFDRAGLDFAFPSQTLYIKQGASSIGPEPSGAGSLPKKQA